MSAWRVLAGWQPRLGRARAPGRRIVIIGTSASGKTTLSRALAELFDCPHVELDALHWEPGWTPADPEVFRARAAAATSGDSWVVDGVYSQVRDIVWRRADTIVWLDYPFTSVLRRLTRRTFGRAVRRELLWGTNRETVRGVLLDKDSLFVWVLQTHWSRRLRYRALLSPGGDYCDKRVVHLRTPREADRWLAAVRARQGMAHG